MSDQQLLLERQARRHALAKIEEHIKQTPNMHVEPSDLKAAGIRHFPLSLEGAKDRTSFFRPYEEELPLPVEEDEFLQIELTPDNIMWDTRALEVFLFDHFHDCRGSAKREYPQNPPYGVYREIGDFKFGQLLECGKFNWYAVSVTDYPDENLPHIKAIVENEAIGDGRLLRGEIMTIKDIMRARPRSNTLRLHIVAPMLVLSLMGPRHARVLEADFDGAMLNIRASKLYDFTRKNTDAVQLLTRYWLGGACGQTTMKS
ncbi:hypothetical protein AtubIFM55763_009564 [Aspergillus tubingensis]|uniref:Uncharacterized protein n=1 Tax=Aspergillus tubingensis TaxID=5068 RepID=A0A8H3XSW3_ASPTU|nr:CorA-like Mg2+ transporter family protein [Aspergillus tubingensis]GFN10638.1 CorA-like Mg2+ transporter family protein [Aspergillus tubingensis]GLA63375.1 hypothetical protein AtubIFM54640_004517 [Aspergillus tubingensis]GLA77382.1 hypothetical protein AtubIFM55763_009564 [Aspergillus tubingensis]GLA80648.1 hypothetical protein AtubIFM56815_001474 [Aspergillus tubingensis]GLB22498.1 hypothetical protein AtubIFM61612_003066 [Aspergillus tubingensis]